MKYLKPLFLIVFVTFSFYLYSQEVPQPPELAGEVPQPPELAGEVPQPPELAGEVPQPPELAGEMPVIGIEGQIGAPPPVIEPQYGMTEITQVPPIKKESFENLNFPSKNEKIYTYWSLGSSSPVYNGDNQEVALEASNRTSYSADLFGMYKPFADKKSMLGFVFNLTVDGFGLPVDNERSNHIELNQYAVHLSWMHFFGKNIGAGLYIRGDLGIAKMPVVFYPSDEVDGTTRKPRADEDRERPRVQSIIGPSFLYGLGWAFPFIETRFLLGLHFGNTYGKHTQRLVSIKTRIISLGLIF